MLKLPRERFIMYMRNFIFGAEDSLVSTVGLLSGIAAAGADRKNIVMTGIVLMFVEAFSMGAGSFLSEQSTEESGVTKHVSFKPTLTSSLIMVVSYVVAGLIPLLPYLLLEPDTAFPVSIIATLISLFLLGVVSAEALKTNIAKNAWRMLFVGGLACAIGVVIGQIFN